VKRLLFIFLLSASAAGCNHTGQILNRETLVVVMPPDELFSCEKMTYPDPDKLTDVQLAGVILDLDTKLNKCYGSNLEVKQFLLDAKERIEKK